jgi:hypothetical protein
MQEVAAVDILQVLADLPPEEQVAVELAEKPALV